VLLSGNHEEIARWRKQRSREKTEQSRADLLDRDADAKIE
jgi:tRNA (guanine-N1)-methyltransferase